MGIEPTFDSTGCRTDGFEDRGSHQAPFASAVTTDDNSLSCLRQQNQLKDLLAMLNRLKNIILKNSICLCVIFCYNKNKGDNMLFSEYIIASLSLTIIHKILE